MNLFSNLRSRLNQAFKTNPVSTVLGGLLGIVLAILLGAFVFVVFCESVEGWVGESLGLYAKNETLKFLGIGMGGVLLALQALMSYKRAKALEDTVQTTEQGQRQERLKNAIEHLGHDSISVRLGGAYELFHLAEDTAELRQTVLDILCAHIRQKTGEDEYRETHKSKPSEEIQSLLTLLFVQPHEVFKGLQINLQGSWLNGADLREARLEHAVMVGAYLQQTILEDSHLRTADLTESRLTLANLRRADLRGANFRKARLQGAHLLEAHLQGACLHWVQMQGVELIGAHMQGASLYQVQMQAADLREARLQLALLGDVKLQAASLDGAQLQAASLNCVYWGGVHSAGLPSAEARIRKQIGKRGSLVGVIFQGGLSEQDVYSILENVSHEEPSVLRARLKPHIDKPESYKLPEGSNVDTGAYTAEDAEQWIAEYNEALSEVPKAADGC